MSLRTSFQRLARRDPGAPTICERLAATADRLSATKEHAGKAAKVARILMKAPEPEPPPVDRVALVNYATWLFMERRLVCAELYPHMGGAADRFVIANNAADRFHFPGRPHGFPGVGDGPPRASARAVRILDTVGVNWRIDLTESRREHNDHERLHDTGERPALPRGWPAVDAELVAALGNLRRIDPALVALVADDSRDADEVPGYEALEDARNEVIATLERERAHSLGGLQAKARALLTTGVRANHETTAALA